MAEVTYDKENKKLVGWESLFALLDDIQPKIQIDDDKVIGRFELLRGEVTVKQITETEFLMMF
jgi:hypothetical protein